MMVIQNWLTTLYYFLVVFQAKNTMILGRCQMSATKMTLKVKYLSTLTSAHVNLSATI